VLGDAVAVAAGVAVGAGDGVGDGEDGLAGPPPPQAVSSVPALSTATATPPEMRAIDMAVS
jgi:hypothetical protein